MRGVGSRNLRDDQCVADRIEARTAVLLRDFDSHEPEFACLPDRLSRELSAGIETCRYRSDLVLGELSRRSLYHSLVFVPFKIHFPSRRAGHYTLPTSRGAEQPGRARPGHPAGRPGRTFRKVTIINRVADSCHSNSRWADLAKRARNTSE